MKEREDVSLVNADEKTSVLTAGDIDWIHSQRRMDKVREERLAEAMDAWEKDYSSTAKGSRKNTALKLEITQRGLLQADVAYAAGMTESRLSRIVNGRARAFDHELKNLARALGMDRDALTPDSEGT